MSSSHSAPFHRWNWLTVLLDEWGSACLPHFPLSPGFRRKTLPVFPDDGKRYPSWQACAKSCLSNLTDFTTFRIRNVKKVWEKNVYMAKAGKAVKVMALERNNEAGELAWTRNRGDAWTKSYYISRWTHLVIWHDNIPRHRHLLTVTKRSWTQIILNLFHSQMDDSDEDDQCALSENWTFQPESRRWSRICDVTTHHTERLQGLGRPSAGAESIGNRGGNTRGCQLQVPLQTTIRTSRSSRTVWFPPATTWSAEATHRLSRICATVVSRRALYQRTASWSRSAFGARGASDCATVPKQYSGGWNPWNRGGGKSNIGRTSL